MITVKSIALDRPIPAEYGFGYCGYFRSPWDFE
jgi:hypothetical protein